MNLTVNPKSNIWVFRHIEAEGRLETSGWMRSCRGGGMKWPRLGMGRVGNSGMKRDQRASMSGMLTRKSTRLWFFGAEGERKVKYTINLGKLLSIYKIVIIATFYRFAVWINKKTFVKYKKSLAYKCDLNPSLEPRWPRAVLLTPAARAPGKGKTNISPFPSGLGDVMISGQNHWNLIELARTYWGSLLYFQAHARFEASRRFLRCFPKQIKDRSSNA